MRHSHMFTFPNPIAKLICLYPSLPSHYYFEAQHQRIHSHDAIIMRSNQNTQTAVKHATTSAAMFYFNES